MFLYFYPMIDVFLQNRLLRWALAVLSGLLLVVAFPETGSCFWISFIAWVPLLLLEHYACVNSKSIGLFFQAYFTFLIYNIGTTWWIYYASEPGAYMAFFANSLLMAIAFLCYHRLKRKIGFHWMIPLFLTTWLSFEFLHFHWELSWPWLTIGNTFANTPSIVQWYSITGVLGGSVWVLIVNSYLTKQLILNNIAKIKIQKKQLITLSVLVFFPMMLSLLLYITKNTSGNSFEVAVIQPNIDPYNAKFTTSNEEQLESIFQQVDDVVSPKTQLVIAPETALYPNSKLDEDRLLQEIFYHQIMERKAKWNNASLLIGASTYRLFDSKQTSACKFIPELNSFVEDYNTSILFGEIRQPEIVHKSKLVLGVEKIPFINTIPFLENLALEMEGGSGTLGIESGPKVMETRNVKFSPVVCYESIYGGFMAAQAKQGSQFIAIITNDGWWRNTPGYKQHFAFARLRAIENNKYVVRSANTGKSGIINNRGDVLIETGWWKKTAFNAVIQLNQTRTIYSYLGDILGYFALIGLFLFYCMRFYKGLHLEKKKL